METLKKPIWRVPLVLGGLGLLHRCLSYILGFLWGRIQIAQGPGPDGAYAVSTGYVSEIAAVISLILFWLAGWRFIRGLARREIFLSASIMVLVNAALLAAEQLSQALGGFSLWVYRFCALAEGSAWAAQLLFRLFDTVSAPLALPSLFTPYLYLVFGIRSAPQ